MTRELPLTVRRKFDSSEPTILEIDIPSAAPIEENMIESVRVKVSLRNQNPAVRMDTVPEADWEVTEGETLRVTWRDRLEGAGPLPVGKYDMEVLIDHGEESPRRSPKVHLNVTTSLEPPPSP
jgi:hypothetical protein